MTEAVISRVGDDAAVLRARLFGPFRIEAGEAETSDATLAVAPAAKPPEGKEADETFFDDERWAEAMREEEEFSRKMAEERDPHLARQWQRRRREKP